VVSHERGFSEKWQYFVNGEVKGWEIGGVSSEWEVGGEKSIYGGKKRGRWEGGRGDVSSQSGERGDRHRAGFGWSKESWLGLSCGGKLERKVEMEFEKPGDRGGFRVWNGMDWKKRRFCGRVDDFELRRKRDSCGNSGVVEERKVVC
jgi:hypothetical protein